MAKVKVSEDLLQLRDIMNQRSGRAVICRLLENLGYWADTFDPDPLIHAKKGGARQHAVALVQQMERDLAEQWLLLLNERLEKMNFNPVKRESDDDDDTDQ